MLSVSHKTTETTQFFQDQCHSPHLCSKGCTPRGDARDASGGGVPGNRSSPAAYRGNKSSPAAYRGNRSSPAAYRGCSRSASRSGQRGCCGLAGGGVLRHVQRARHTLSAFRAGPPPPLRHRSPAAAGTNRSAPAEVCSQAGLSRTGYPTGRRDTLRFE